MKVTWGKRWAAALVVAVVALAGCGSDGGGSGASAGGARPSGVPEVDTERDLPELPLDRYEFGRRDYDRQEAAALRLTQACMKSYGFADFPLRWHESDTLSSVAVGTLISTTLTGSLDLDRACRVGYGMEGDALKEYRERHSKGRLVRQDEREALRGTGKALDGSSKVNGREVPDGGCYQRGQRQLWAGVKDEPHMTGYVTKRRAALDKAVAEDRRMRRALDAWADCVEGKGFKRYASPEAAFRDKAWRRGGDGRTGRTRQERDTAVADIECKREHNTAGVWWTVAAEKQRYDISRHKAAYDAVRADLERVRAAVRRALA
ncbi:hypothetical protein [Streptomyces sp. NRRL B-1347]|uniref:hypothetical protein n=1 Tax=Streptomyces sp. NRRL B-1347 TaxID=1476877 RepID=UPI0004C49828|nr:hypothetical protein [Streptomyces sp. NRRL B-1347]